VLVMFLFAAACPFIIFPKPLYIALLDSNNPIKSKVSMLEVGGKTVGSVMLVPDYDIVRKEIIPLVKKFFPQKIRVLERTYYGWRVYYSLPTLKNFVIDTREPGEVSWKRSVYFPLNGSCRNFDLQLVKREPLSGELEETQNKIIVDFIGIYTGPLLDFAYTQYPDTIPWDAVQVQNGQEVFVLNYVALLDHAFECFATGKMDEALNTLDEAASNIPPYNLEAARLATLQYMICREFLNGNIGEIQSLPYLHEAYKLFLLSEDDPRFSKRDPLTNWLQRSLLGGYQDWSWTAAFFDRISELKQIPHIADDQKSYFDILGDSLKSKSYKDLLVLLKSEPYSTPELHFIKYTAYGKFTEEWLGDLAAITTNGQSLLIGDNDPNAEKVNTTLADAEHVIPIIQSIDSMLAKKGDLNTDPNMLVFLEFARDDMPKVYSANASDIGKILEQQSKANSDAKTFYMWFLWMQNGIPEKELLKGKETEWRTPEYSIWFAHWFEDAVIEIHQHDYPSDTHYPPVNHDMRQLLSKYGLNPFIKDKNGSGQTFLPGLFCLTWYSQTFGLDGSDQLKQQFESETLIPFDAYLASLYQVREQENATNMFSF